MDLMIFEKNIGIFAKISEFLFLIFSGPSTMLEHLFGHYPTLPRLKGPSWTFMDPQMDPKMDPARQISEDPW